MRWQDNPFEQVQSSSPLEKLTQSRALVDTTQHNTTLAADSLLPKKLLPPQIHHDRPSLANVGFDLEKFCDHRGKDGISQKEIFCSRELIRYSMGDVTVTKVRQKKQF